VDGFLGRKEMTSENTKKSIGRRSFLGVAGSTLVAAALVGAQEAAAQAKVSQKSVAYQPTPKGDQRCDNCRLFEAPDGCKNVQGPIAPQGWCRIWGKKA
jgi:hypothetical protein